MYKYFSEGFQYECLVMYACSKVHFSKIAKLYLNIIFKK